MLKNNIDHLVLGCSHYPYLIPQLAKLIPNNIKIIDSGEAVAKQTKNILLEKNLLRESSNQPIIQFITNSSDITLKLLLKGYLEKVDIEKIKF
jgi:glutamate racemase